MIYGPQQACFSCEKNEQKYITGLCEECHQIVEAIDKFDDKTRYVDIIEFASKYSDIYMDFEGFADPVGILEKAEKVANIIGISDEEKIVLKTLLVHFLYDCRDQADYEVSENVLMDVAAGIYMAITCRYFLKENI